MDLSQKTEKASSADDTDVKNASLSGGTYVGQGQMKDVDLKNGEIQMELLPTGVSEAYERKVAIMNQALVDLKMGPFQWKIFALTGFGWFVDNVRIHVHTHGSISSNPLLQFWLQAITIISAPVQNEFAVKRIAFLTVGKYAGLVVGSTLWPMTADFIGRRLAFNVTLLISAVGGLVGAGSPNFVALATFCAFIGLGTGGNQPVDSAIFLEFIPATHQYLLTMQSAFWSVGQAIAALIGWPPIANYSCPSAGADCGYSNNLGWRYTYSTFGGLTLVMFLLRLLFRVPETPKYLLSKGLDQQKMKNNYLYMYF